MKIELLDVIRKDKEYLKAIKYLRNQVGGQSEVKNRTENKSKFIGFLGGKNVTGGS